MDVKKLTMIELRREIKHLKTIMQVSAYGKTEILELEKLERELMKRKGM